MKKIYTFTLDEPDALSEKVKSDFRVIGYWMYDQISEYEYDINKSILVRNKYLKYNELLEHSYCGIYYYRFLSDKLSSIDYFFEPIMFNDTSFGITVYDGVISDSTINELLDLVKRNFKFDYNISLNSVLYDAKDISDESSRVKAIKKFKNNCSYMYNNSTKKLVLKRNKLISNY